MSRFGCHVLDVTFWMSHLDVTFGCHVLYVTFGCHIWMSRFGCHVLDVTSATAEKLSLSKQSCVLFDLIYVQCPPRKAIGHLKRKDNGLYFLFIFLNTFIMPQKFGSILPLSCMRKGGEALTET